MTESTDRGRILRAIRKCLVNADEYVENAMNTLDDIGRGSLGVGMTPLVGGYAMKDSKDVKKIRVVSTQKDNRVLLKVADSGPGIPRHIRDKVFDPFFTTKTDSSGIGLSISHRIISDHGGSIDIEESEMGGAEFTVALPIPTNG